MAIIYYYVEKDKVSDFLKYGIKLSENFSKEVNINGYLKQCFFGLINPKDDENKYNSENFECLKLDIPTSNCRVFDNSLQDGQIKHMPSIELDKYIFGKFKTPEVAITSSILPEHISVLNKEIDCPVLFDNSRDLFYQLRIQIMLDELSPKEAYLALKNYIDNSYWFFPKNVLLLQLIWYNVHY